MNSTLSGADDDIYLTPTSGFTSELSIDLVVLVIPLYILHHFTLFTQHLVRRRHEQEK